MWITVLLGFFGLILQGRAQDVTSVDSVTAEPAVNQAVNWDTTGPVIRVNVQDGRYNAVRELQNEGLGYPQFYTNQWRAEVLPIYINPQRNPNLHMVESEDFDDESISTLNTNSDSNVNQTVPSISDPNSESTHPVYSDSIYHYPEPPKSAESQYAAVPLPARPQTFNPNAIRINLSRSYATNVKEVQNSTDSNPNASVSEPVTSSYEERYTQVLPNLPFPSMPVLPYQGWPYGNMNQQGYYPMPAQFYYRPYPAPSPGTRNIPPPPIMNSNGPVFDREMGSEIHETSQADRQYPQYGTPVSTTGVQGLVDIIPRVPPTFIPPNPLQDSPARYPPVLPPPVFPPYVPNPYATRGLPWSPSPLPESVPRVIPVTDAIPEPLPVDNKPPLEPLSEQIPSVDSSLDSSTYESLETSEKGVVEGKLEPSIIPYGFGYDMNDGQGTDQHRAEASDGAGVVTGSYGYKNAFGLYRLVHYIADKNGFRAFVKSNEPGVPSFGSADVVVMADDPPPHVVAEGSKIEDPVAVEVPETFDLIAEGSEIKTEEGK